ncbi:unnamed protein product, partial [Hymenolepis diminuta]
GLSPNIFVEDDRFIESFGDHSRQLGDFSLNLSEIKAPKCIGEVVEVTSLTESHAVELILAAEGRRDLSQWLVVYIRDTTTAIIFPPHGCNSLSRCGLTFCMEWLEKCGITQLIIVVPDGDGSNQICRNLLFIGFSILPKDVVTDRLPSWVCSSESSSVSSCSDEEFDLDLSPILKSLKKPDRISIVEVEDLDTPASMEAVLSADLSRGSMHWLVVYVKGSTTAVLIPPRESHHNHSFNQSGLTACLEWLEAAHMSQILVAVPFRDGESMCKKLLFLGFSILPKGIVNEQLPSWCDGYTVLVTDFSEF